MKIAIVTAAVGIGLAAHAGAANAKGCHSASHIVGHSRCHTFGTGWEPPLIAWRFEGVFLHFEPGDGSFDPIDKAGTKYHFTLLGPKRVSAVGGRYGYRIGWRGYYVADEFTFGGVVSGPGIEGGPVSGPGTAMADSVETPASNGGFLFGWDLGIGKEVPIGRFYFAAEIAAGVRVVSFDTQYKLVSPASIDGTIEPRLRAGVWLTHWFSVSAFAGANVLAKGDYELGLSLGLHLMPYDAVR